MDRASLLLHVRNLSKTAAELSIESENAGLSKESQRLGFITELLWTLRDDLEGTQRPKIGMMGTDEGAIRDAFRGD